MELEPEMLATETIVPVYFAMEDDELLSIYTQTLTSSSSQGSLSAAEGREPADDVYDFKRHVLDFYNVFCAFSSPAAYGHSQRLSDGDQWSSEQSSQWLGHHQFRGEPHYKLIGCSFIFSDFILVLFLARLWRWIMLLLYSHMLTILTSVTTDPWDNCQSVYCALWQIKKGEIRYQLYAF